jgi:hypothetical protein
MPQLFVPPTVARELLDERRQFTAAVIKACKKDDVCRRWDKELQRLDPLLEMIVADVQVVGTPLLAGYYHLVRMNETTMPTVTPVTGPNGERIEPPGRLLEQLKATDLWNPQVTRLRERAVKAEQERNARLQEQARTDRQADMLEQWRAVSETSISMNRSAPWSQNVSGRRGRKVD